MNFFDSIKAFTPLVQDEVSNGTIHCRACGEEVAATFVEIKDHVNSNNGSKSCVNALTLHSSINFDNKK